MADEQDHADAAKADDEPLYWTLSDWANHFDLSECGEKLQVDRYYIFCPCKGHGWCLKTNTNAKSAAIGSIWLEEDGPKRQLCHLQSSPKHTQDGIKYDLEWCEAAVHETPALVRKEHEWWTVDQLNSDPPPWVQCPKMPRSKKQQDFDSDQGKGGGMGVGKGKGKKGKDKQLHPYGKNPPEPSRPPKRAAAEMEVQPAQPLAIQTPPLAVPIPHLMSMAAAGIGPQNARALLASGVDGARNAPRSEFVATCMSCIMHEVIFADNPH